MSADWTGSIVSTFSWELPKRWRVKYDPCPAFAGMTYWAVYAPSGLLAIERFRTWREALEFADRMARTREVVLPRQLNTKRPVGTTKKYWEVAPNVGTQNFLIRRRREDGHICQQITVNRKDLGLLAPILLAVLAEQEESCGR